MAGFTLPRPLKTKVIICTYIHNIWERGLFPVQPVSVCQLEGVLRTMYSERLRPRPPPWRAEPSTLADPQLIVITQPPRGQPTILCKTWASVAKKKLLSVTLLMSSHSDVLGGGEIV